MKNWTVAGSKIPAEQLKRWHQKLDRERPMREIEGRSLKDKYKRLGMSRAELSRISGISAATIAKFEQGRYVRSWQIVKQSLRNAIRIKCYEMLIKAVSRLNPDWLH